MGLSPGLSLLILATYLIISKENQDMCLGYSVNIQGANFMFAPIPWANTRFAPTEKIFI